jgi:hypothetical protein
MLIPLGKAGTEIIRVFLPWATAELSIFSCHVLLHFSDVTETQYERREYRESTPGNCVGKTISRCRQHDGVIKIVIRDIFILTFSFYLWSRVSSLSHEVDQNSLSQEEI